jgi:hypothetical protein
VGALMLIAVLFHPVEKEQKKMMAEKAEAASV